MGGPGLNTEIFATGRTAEAAQRAKKLENLYHVGQHKLWDGRQVLEDLQSRHGRAPAELPRAQREALAAVVGGLMWGELAAWQISAQLADRLDHYEGKLAATSQVHDEARHFYVLHDYLRLLELPQPPLEGRTRALIDVVLTTDDLVHKLIGMQLFIESVALTLFKALRDRAVCPILTELLMFFERDEARHVGFGVQLTPDLVRHLGPLGRLQLDTFQLRILGNAMLSLRANAPHLVALGLDPSAMARHGLQRMFQTVALLAEANGRPLPAIGGPAVARGFEAAIEALFPEEPTWRGRALGVARALRSA